VLYSLILCLMTRPPNSLICNTFSSYRTVDYTLTYLDLSHLCVHLNGWLHPVPCSLLPLGFEVLGHAGTGFAQQLQVVHAHNTVGEPSCAAARGHTPAQQ
jgi:hypothetical protein